MVHQVLKQKDRDTAWADRPALAPPSPRPAHHPPTDKIIEYNRIISVFNYPTQLITAIVRMYGAESTALWNIYIYENMYSRTPRTSIPLNIQLITK